MCTKYVSCIQNVQQYVQNTYILDVMVAVFLLAKPPPSTTQNGMFLSYNHHKNIKNNIFLIYKMYATYFCQHVKMYTKYSKNYK